MAVFNNLVHLEENPVNLVFGSLSDLKPLPYRSSPPTISRHIAVISYQQSC